jgi:P27 family predicted phage terminase small subunit
MGNFLSGPRELGAQPVPPLIEPVGLDAQLQPYWQRIMELLPPGVAGSHDAQIVLQLCQAMHVRDTAYAQILEGGIAVADAAHGDEPRRNPAIITWRQAAEMCTQLMNLLGLSPVSRLRIQGADTAQADPFLDYLRRRNGSNTG